MQPPRSWLLAGSTTSPGIHGFRYENCRFVARERSGGSGGCRYHGRYLHTQEVRHERRILWLCELPAQLALQLFDALSCEKKLPQLAPLVKDQIELVLMHDSLFTPT
jgi:hypothetical protein